MRETQTAESELSEDEVRFLKAVIAQTYAPNAPQAIGEALAKRGLVLRPVRANGYYCVTVAGLRAATDECHRHIPPRNILSF